ncbi:bifunctional 2-polyprenyl-6-hydroxyphenol methylase/3-demethylubiquinol 3-O-methyltransferase UbiG [Chitinophaga sp. S165]|uniref:class I SAM-dependent methyltransferase n=1 Tax=Chitinophaga sp. S165 TaxID=2135462 RepID=UPI000D7179FD|nr:class I SAM-dependent methyltransferase [Chitinophaga sp. S165]PWV50570.1 methyltransferase family protein [Chitinophaga sp. S165]
MRYLLYFLYVGWHWGLGLAVFIIRHEIRGEKKYAIRTIGTDNLTTDVSKEDRKHVAMYEPVNYYTATWLFDRLEPADMATTLLDVGCGRGRVLAMGAAYGFTALAGIDLSPRLYNAAIKMRDILYARYQHIRINLACQDARAYTIPETVGVIFLFNPFDHVIMEEFIGKVEESLRRKQRPLKILYANPQCKQQWLDAGFEETASFVKMNFLKGSVLEKA